jgi:CBS domain-containing protein
VVKGFEILLSNKLLSAPVYDKATNKYTGFLDIRDLISFCVFIYDNNIQAENLLDIVNYGVKMFKHAVDGVTITYLSRRNPFHAVKQGAPLMEVVDILARGVRRVPVVNEVGNVINIVSQSSIIQFLQNHLGEVGNIFATKVGASNVGSAPVLAVKKDTVAIDVFRMMDQNKRSGVAVVDDAGMLVGNTSGADLKLFINTPSMSVLQIPIVQFLNQIRSQNIDIMVPVITVTTDDTLAFLIGKLAATRVHRVFVVDSKFHPTKVVSITDVLRFVQKTIQESK